jgi:hypothetical protein
MIIRSYDDASGRPCRVYLSRIMIDGRSEPASAAVCRQPGGEWKLSTPDVTAQEVTRRNFACPKPGTVIETSVGGRLDFVIQDGFRCWYRTGQGANASRFAMLLDGESNWLRQGGQALAMLWPLKPGNQQWFSVTGADREGFPASWYETYTVVGREAVRVPAGTFDAFVIRWEEQARGEGNYYAASRFWFAPEVGYFVKFEAARSPGSPGADWEATRINTIPDTVAPVAARPVPKPSKTAPRRP